MKWLFVLCWFVILPVFASDRIVMLLPQTTPEQSLASKAIAQGVKSVLGAQVLSVNRDDYASFSDAWTAVMRLKPSAVVGPLHETDVASLIRLSPVVPVLALNQIEKSHENVWQLAMRTPLPAYQLALHLADRSVDKLLVLSRQDGLSERLQEAFLAVNPAQLVDLVSYAAQDQLLGAAQVLLHTSRGRARIQTLNRLLAQPVQTYPWARQDVDALVVVAPLADALALSYQIDYLWGQSLSLYWLDSGSNALTDYVRSASNWGRMKTFMPLYQLAAMRHAPIADGFFHALGQDAGHLLQLRLGRGQWDDGSVLEGKLGELSMGESNHIRINLPLVWLGDGQVEAIER